MLLAACCGAIGEAMQEGVSGAMRGGDLQVVDRQTTRLVCALLVWLSLLVPSLAAQQARIEPSEIVTLLPKDAIPAIRDATAMLVPANEATGVRDSDQVLGVTIAGDSRAYPMAFLSWHEIINDTVGGVSIAASW